MSQNLLLPIFHIWQRQLYSFNSSDKKTMTLLFLDSVSDSFINSFGYAFTFFFWNLTISLTQHHFTPEVLEYLLPHLPFSVVVSPIVCSQSRGQNDLFKHVSSCNFFVQNIPMASFSLIWNKSQGHDMCLLCWNYYISSHFLLLLPSITPFQPHSEDVPLIGKVCFCLRSFALDVSCALNILSPNIHSFPQYSSLCHLLF